MNVSQKKQVIAHTSNTGPECSQTTWMGSARPDNAQDQLVGLARSHKSVISTPPWVKNPPNWCVTVKVLCDLLCEYCYDDMMI